MHKPYKKTDFDEIRDRLTDIRNPFELSVRLFVPLIYFVVLLGILKVILQWLFNLSESNFLIMITDGFTPFLFIAFFGIILFFVVSCILWVIKSLIECVITIPFIYKSIFGRTLGAVGGIIFNSRTTIIVSAIVGIILVIAMIQG